MARRKRASMREGPLADLFRSTVEPDDPPEAPTSPTREEDTRVMDEGAADAPSPSQGPRREPEERFERRPEPPAEHSPERPIEQRPTPPVEPESALPDPERVRAYRVEESEAPPPPPAKDRLSRIFGEDMPDVEGPAFGREEPSFGREMSVGEPRPHTPVIRVVGVGGAGVNAINRMVEAQIPGVEFMAINTDLQSLQQSSADVTVHLGSGVSRGLGTGSNPELGYRAAFEEQDKIKRLLKGSDMVFVTAGAGGGTGTGAAPVVARLARDVGALTVGIVTKPFRFEGTRRAKQADDGVEALGAEVDTLIVVPNERLLNVLAKTTTMVEAFQVADDVLRQGVQGISELITLPGLINLDFADVRTTMRDAGQALLGIGMGTGENRAALAAEGAVSSPLLETSVDGARSILLSITGGEDLSLLEVSEAAKTVQEAAHPDANIIFGANIDETLDDQVWVTVIATRFDGRARRADGTSGERRPAGTTTTSTRRPEDRRAGTAKSFESRPRDLSIEVPEFVPGR
jgi:cell division protein FtsZ